MRPVVGILGNFTLVGDHYPAHATGTMLCAAVAEVAGCLPLSIPADPALVAIEELMAVCDGFVLPGGRPNVHPEEYGHAPTAAHGEFDRGRDRVALPLIRACVAAGQPVMGICRGFQEMNVAFGGTLHPEIREIPGRMNHRMPPEGTLEERFSRRHPVSLVADGQFAALYGCCELETNTLHGQGICAAGPRVVVEGQAPDGTIEAIRIAGAAGFTLSVQWHPEFCAATDPVSRPLFEAFGAACRAFAAARAR